MTYLQAIAERVSVRTFKKTAIGAASMGAAVLSKLRALIQDADPGKAPGALFGSQIRWVVLEAPATALSNDSKPVKVGTYGIIRGAVSYLVPVISASLRGTELVFALIDIGYRMEGIVLELTRLGIGTCWLGGTFRKGSLIEAAKIPESEAVYAVLAMGLGTGNRALMDAFITKAAGSTQRKKTEEIFFDLDAGTPLPDLAESLIPQKIALSNLLAALRRAPSASNRQPWRLQVSGLASLGTSSLSAPSINNEARAGQISIDLYLERDEKYESMAGYPIQYIDGGIAASHIEIAAKELGFELTRRFTALASESSKLRNMEFILGWNIIL